MHRFPSPRILKGALALAAGATLLPAFFVAAQSQTDLEAAFADLERVTGQRVTSKAEARALCNQERFLTECAEIGKSRKLYKEPERIKQVDVLLGEL
ncbi:MAG: hypothetical protein Q8R13_01295, partial [bacterium]|nr:hypothetical protein [bacterium]